MKIATYHVEACDNAKFLGATEKFSHAVYLEVCHKHKLYLLIHPCIYFIDTTNDDNTATKTSSHGEVDLQCIFLLQQFCQNSFFSG